MVLNLPNQLQTLFSGKDIRRIELLTNDRLFALWIFANRFRSVLGKHDPNIPIQQMQQKTHRNRENKNCYAENAFGCY